MRKHIEESTARINDRQGCSDAALNGRRGGGQDRPRESTPVVEFFRRDQLQNGLRLRNLAYTHPLGPIANDGGFGVSVDCPFCRPDRDRVRHDDPLVFALRDGFPVSLGHVLVIPHRHVGSFFETTLEERRSTRLRPGNLGGGWLFSGARE